MVTAFQSSTQSSHSPLQVGVHAWYRNLAIQQKHKRSNKFFMKIQLYSQLPTKEVFETYKIKQLRLLFESQGMDPIKFGKEFDELKEKAIEKFYTDKKKKKKKGKKADEEEEL